MALNRTEYEEKKKHRLCGSLMNWSWSRDLTSQLGWFFSLLSNLKNWATSACDNEINSSACLLLSSIRNTLRTFSPNGAYLYRSWKEKIKIKRQIRQDRRLRDDVSGWNKNACILLHLYIAACVVFTMRWTTLLVYIYIYDEVVKCFVVWVGECSFNKVFIVSSGVVTCSSKEVNWRYSSGIFYEHFE